MSWQLKSVVQSTSNAETATNGAPRPYTASSVVPSGVKNGVAKTRVRVTPRVRVRVRVRVGVRVRVRSFGDFPTFFSDFPTRR